MAEQTDSPREEPPWHAMENDAVFKQLECSAELKKSGLTTEEAEERLAKFGENKLSEKEKVTLLQRIWHLWTS